MEPKPVIIPSASLNPQTLQAVIEEFVGREGTDYGMREVTHASKCTAVRKQIETGRAVIVFDPETESTTILKADDPVVRGMLKS